MLRLKFTKAEWEGLEEGLQKFYEEKDGEYVLAVEGLEDTAGLKSALQKERADREKFAKQVKAWETLGKSPEEISELLTKLGEEEAKKAEKAGEWEKLKAQILESHKKEMGKKDEEIAKMRQSLESYLVDASATAAIAELKGVPQLLLPHVKTSVKVVENEGRYVVQIVDAAGTPRVNSKGEPLTIKELVEEMRLSEVFGRAFEPTGTSGGGASGGKPSNSAGIKNPWKKETFNLTEQGRIYRENPKLAEQLEKEAEAS
jgi:DNA-binding transcriptional MerR regulator